MTNHTKLLQPFDKESQSLLKSVDAACQTQMMKMKEEATLAALGNNPFEVDLETLVWTRLIRAYGILYNRAIEAGWVDDVHLGGVDGMSD